MKLCTDLVFDGLSAHYAAYRLGKDVNELILDPPAFFEPHSHARNGGVYICTADELSRLKTTKHVLIVVCGEPSGAAFPKVEHRSIIVLPDRPPVNEVFNRVQDVFRAYGDWEYAMLETLDEGGDVSEMIGATSNLFDECICICNKELEIVRFHNPRPANPVPFTHLTHEGMQMFLDSHARNVAHREPFLFRGDTDTYCLNIYKNDEYLGVVTLPTLYHPLTEGRKRVFERFCSFLNRAIERLGIEDGLGLANLKMVFRSLLMGEAMNDAIIERVAGGDGARRKWVCLVAQLTDPMRRLPPEYFCRQLEKADERLAAVDFEGGIAMILPVFSLDDAHEHERLLVPVIERLFGRVGASIAFNNLSNARIYYRQAKAALETGIAHGKESVILPFSENAFEYMLDNCMGEFSPKYLLPKALLELRPEGTQAGEVDYWATLKCYLDNEMNASVTARELFIHRTTLQHRIERIERTVNLSDARSRLYLQLCMHLYDSYEAQIGNPPA